MKGRHAGQLPLTAAEELRQATREAHAAVKDLRAAIRDGRAERDALEHRLEQHLTAEIGRCILEYEKQLQGRVLSRYASMQEQLTDIVAYLDRMVGVTSPEQLREEIIGLMMNRLIKALEAEGSAAAAARLAGYLPPIAPGMPVTGVKQAGSGHAEPGPG